MLIYVCFRQDTYVGSFFSSYLGGLIDHYDIKLEGLRIIIQNYAADCLWAYSLAFSVSCVWGEMPENYLISFAVSSAFAMFVECSQKLGFMNGTFDIWDIIAEVFAIAIAVLVIKSKIKGNCYENKVETY